MMLVGELAKSTMMQWELLLVEVGSSQGVNCRIVVGWT